MSVVVTDNVQEEFSKPPPKKKWLQNYIEQDSEGCEGSLGNHIREETQEFVKLLGKKTASNEGLRQWKAANTSQKLTLSQDVIGGVVQGVIDQFHNFFENDKEDSKEQNDSGDNKEEQKLSQDDITPVVQSVISQFLNGSLSDSGFRRSRKRSHKHVNSRSKDRSGSSSFSSSASASRVSSGRNSSVIQFNTSASNASSAVSTPIASSTIKPPIKVRKLETMINSSKIKSQAAPAEYLSESNEALNLSCPKNNTTKVTFANEDKCYSIDSVKSFQESKSRKMFSLDYSRRIHENLQLIVNADGDEDGPLDLADKSKKNISSNFISSFKEHKTPVIHFRESPKIHTGPRLVLDKEPSPRPSTITPPIISGKICKSKEYSSLPASRQTSPISITPVRHDNSAFFPPILNKTMCDTAADPEIFATKDATIPFAVIKPKPIKPSVDAKLKLSSNQILPNFYASKHGHSIFSFSDSFKQTSKVTQEMPVKEQETIPGGSRPSMREVHNRLEKNRRAHLKSCFNELASQCDLDPNKASNLLVIRSAYKCIMGLRREGREQERNLANLVQEKIKRQNRLNELRREVSGFNMDSDSE